MQSRLSKRLKYYILSLTLLGAIFRLFAYSFNDIPHGDVTQDYAAGVSFLSTGKLKLPLITTRPYLEPRYEDGIPLDQHPPLWSILGGSGARIIGDVYVTFKIMTLLVGIGMIPLSYYVFSQIFGRKPALLGCTLITFSYLLIDYSGNGSLYILHSFLYILVVFFISENRRIYQIALGGTLGLLYLLNYQAIVAVLAVVGVYFLIFTLKEMTWKTSGGLWISLAVFFLFISPWLIRNQRLFGNAFFNIGSGYVISALKIPSEIVLMDGHLLTINHWDQYDFSKIPGMVASWTFRNIFYFVGRILVLAPVVSIFLPLAGFRLRSRKLIKEGNKGILMAALLLAGQVMISILWPVFKFRYFVPMMPLVFGLSSYGLFSFFKREKTQNMVVLISVAALIFVSVVTYFRVPSHTNYYDSNEFFHYRTGEKEWRAQVLLLIDAAAHINEHDSTSPVISPEAIVNYYVKRPIVFINSVKDKEIISYLVERYDVQFILETHPKANFYQEFLDSEVIYQNAVYSVLQVND